MLSERHKSLGKKNLSKICYETYGTGTANGVEVAATTTKVDIL